MVAPGKFVIKKKHKNSAQIQICLPARKQRDDNSVQALPR